MCINLKSDLPLAYKVHGATRIKTVFSQETMKLLMKILKSPGCRKIPLLVSNQDDVVVSATNFTSERICPIFQVTSRDDLLSLVKVKVKSLVKVKVFITPLLIDVFASNFQG